MGPAAPLNEVSQACCFNVSSNGVLDRLTDETGYKHDEKEANSEADLLVGHLWSRTVCLFLASISSNAVSGNF